MKNTTLQKILSDPNFDPSAIFEEALVAFIERNPQRMAEDKFIYKYLIEDIDLVRIMAKTINPNAPNFLSLERVDEIVSVFVNGVLVGEVWSDRFPEGRIGLGGRTYNDPNATVCLDNLRVWRLE